MKDDVARGTKRARACGAWTRRELIVGAVAATATSVAVAMNGRPVARATLLARAAITTDDDANSLLAAVRAADDIRGGTEVFFVAEEE